MLDAFDDEGALSGGRDVINMHVGAEVGLRRVRPRKPVLGAGTGIATRELICRGAIVIAVDPGHEVLRRARARSAGLAAVIADGALLPVRCGTADLACFGQAWHWLDRTSRVAEAHRVLRRGGRWAAWWSHARADGERWFDEYWVAIERWCPGTHRGQRDTDCREMIAVPGLFEVDDRLTVAWLRQISVDDWMTDQASHSYVAAFSAGSRAALLRELRAVLDRSFPAGQMAVHHETWLWTATRL